MDLAVLVGILVNFVAIVRIPVKLESRLTKIEVTQSFLLSNIRNNETFKARIADREH